jgi:predicted amidohydrolase
MTIFAAVQLTTTDDYQNNINKAVNFVEKAAKYGAKVVSLPETFAFIGKKENKFKYSQDLNGEISQIFSGLAKNNGIFILAGSIHESIQGSDKLYNTSMLFSPEGKMLDFYRKIHLFDANLPGPEKYQESDDFAAGNQEQIKVTDTSSGKLGLTICYDLRFPELYRKLAQKGAEIIFVPSAFTMQTGKDHWEVLLRARAIENQVYIIAPGQYGFHSERRESYGNSMIIDPWGKVISRASDREEIIYADIDLEYLKKIRQKLPCLNHIRIE